MFLVLATNISIQAEFGEKGKLVEEPKEEPKEELKEEIVERDSSDENESKKKTDEVIQYMADEKGEFKVVETPVVVINEEKEGIKKIIMNYMKSQGTEFNASYLKFLEVLFKNGNVKIGEVLPQYNKFLEEIKSAKIKCVEKEVKDFLTICNLVKITDMSGPEKKIAKDYATAKEIISLLS